MALRHRLADRGRDRTLLLLLPAVLFVVALFVYPFVYGLQLSFQPQPGSETVQRYGSGPFAAYRAFFPDPRRAEHPRHGADRGGAPGGHGPHRLAQPPAARHGRRGPPRTVHAQLLGRAVLAGHLRVPVRVPAAPVVSDRHRPDAGAGRGHAGRRVVAAVPPHHAAAAGPGAGHNVLPDVRAGVLGVPLGGHGRRSVARHPGDLDRGLPRGVRAVRLLDGVGDRHDHGRRRADRHRPGPRLAGPALPGRGGRQGMTTSLLTPRRRLALRPGAWLVWGAVAFFLLFFFWVVVVVVVDSFGTRWFGGWLPSGWQTRWYGTTGRELGRGGGAGRR